MPAESPPFTHHLVGAVHVLTVFRSDTDLTRRILEQERSVCSARRIIVDLSRLDGAHDEHLDVIQEFEWNRDLMVRLIADRPPVSLDRLPESTDTAVAAAG